MPPQKVTGGLGARLGAKFRLSFDKHKDDETEVSQFGELPPGIEGGIARLVECKFDTYKKGDLQGNYFFYAAGVVISPRDHGGQRIEGLRTMIMEPLCDTPKRSRETVDEHLAWILNEMRKLGVDTSNLSADDLEDTAAALKEAGVYFKFRTWRGDATKEFPNPRTNHQWGGVVPYTEDESEGAVEDSTGEVEEDKEPTWKGAAEKERAKFNGAGAKTGRTNAAVPNVKGAKGKAEEPFDEFGDDPAVLGERADNDDDAAQKKLEEMAASVGIDAKRVKKADSWAEVAEMIVEAGDTKKDEEDEGEEDEEEDKAEDEEADEEEEAGEAIPKVDDVYLYLPPKAKKPVECEVMAVNVAKRTVKLRNLDDRKLIYKDISWDKIKEVE